MIPITTPSDRPVTDPAGTIGALARGGRGFFCGGATAGSRA